MTRGRLLLVDDDTTLTELLSEHLHSVGYEVEVANDAADALRLLQHRPPDLLILDVMMPGTDGWQVLEQLRPASQIPVIMLTAKDHEIDKLRAFHLGVDDYVTKPFSFAELTARVGAVLSRLRRAGEQPERIVSGDLVIDLVHHRVLKGEEPVELSPTEFRLLEALARRRDIPVAAEELVRLVWGPAYAGEVEHVKHYIWSLRRKLEADPGNPQHVLTERGFGYRFV